MFFEDYVILAIFIIVVLLVLSVLFFAPVVDSYTLICDGVEYQFVDFDVETDCIELYDHRHLGFSCGEKCSRQYIAKAENTFEVIPHKSSYFERIFNK